MSKSILIAFGLMGLLAAPVMANDYLTGDLGTTAPITRYRAVSTVAAMPVAAPACPTACYRPVSNYQPVSCYQPVTSCQPVSCYQPVTNCQPVNCYQPVANCQPVNCYQPVVAYSPVAAPMQVVAYQPVAAPMAVTAYAPVAAAPAVAAQPLLTRTKYYVPGQPIRNVFRAILPGVPTGVVAAPY